MLFEESKKLACAVLELAYDKFCNDSIRTDIINDELYNRFGIGFEQFHELVEALLPFTPVVASLPGGKYHAFVVEEGGVCTILVKHKEE